MRISEFATLYVTSGDNATLRWFDSEVKAPERCIVDFFFNMDELRLSVEVENHQIHKCASTEAK